MIAPEFVSTNRNAQSRRDKLPLFTMAISSSAAVGSVGNKLWFLPEKWRKKFFSPSARFRTARPRNEFLISLSRKSSPPAQIYSPASNRFIAGKKTSRPETKRWYSSNRARNE